MDLRELETALASYIDNEIMPAMSGASQIKKIGIAAAIAQAKSSGFIDKYFNMMVNDPIFVALGIATEDGKLGDTDVICNSLKEALEKNGTFDVPVLDIRFSAGDVDVLRGYLSGSSNPKDRRKDA